MIENGMIVGAEQEWTRRCESHWENDRSWDLVTDFADDTIVLEAMKNFLRVDDMARDDALQECFEALGKQRQYEILVDYIGSSDKLRADFDTWYDKRYKEE